MEKATARLSHVLLDRIYTAQVLKQVSDQLEEIASNKHFLSHAHAIVSDATLTNSQKKTQLSYLIRSLESPELYSFLSNCIDEAEWWLFEKGKINYFDRFVQTFQQYTQEVELVYLTTAIPLKDTFLKQVADDLKKSFNKHVIIHHTVKHTLLGGVQVKIENIVFDYSLKYKFRQFERQWLKTLKTTDQALARHT